MSRTLKLIEAEWFFSKGYRSDDLFETISEGILDLIFNTLAF